MPSDTSRTRRGRGLTGLAGAAALVLAFPATAFAAPPAPLPAAAGPEERTYQPAYDYDTDGCYPAPAIGPDGTVNGGLKPAGALDGDCRDAAGLDRANGYSRSLCDRDWCAHLYALYFEKDQAVPGSGIGGHRHDWEHVVVWVRDGTVQYVSVSRHGSFTVHPRSAVRFDGTHPKVVYHKDGIGTHCFRLAGAGDEPPENHEGAWQRPALVGWNGYPPGVREELTAYDFGSAVFGLKDGSFASHLAAARPTGIAFDPYA